MIPDLILLFGIPVSARMSPSNQAPALRGEVGTGSRNRSTPTASVLLGLLLLGTMEAGAGDSVSYEQVHAFLGGPADGELLYDSVMEGSDGRLYGTTLNGGPEDGGLVFALNKDGSDYVILHGFGLSPTNGLSPWGGVIEGADGQLYGATRHGGENDAGIVFGIRPDGTAFRIVRTFTTNVNDGAYPLNSVIEGRDGRLYGRTLSGGSQDGCAVFGMNKNGTGYAVLHSFDFNLPDYWDAYSGLIEGSDGVLYGTTFEGGLFGCGSVFRLNMDGTGFLPLHDFRGDTTDGGYPYGSVYEASDGVLYGATSGGGPDDYGTLYRVNRDGSGYSVLRHFTPDNSEGYLPVSVPVEGPGGWLFGTTYFGGVDEGGTLYAVRKDGSGFAFLRDFLYGGMDGTEPNGRLLLATDGALYGTTFTGGLVYGSVFRIAPVALRLEKAAGSCTVVLEGFVSHRYALEASDSLPSAWTGLATVTNVNGVVQWSDTRPTADRRIYRARVLNP